MASTVNKATYTTRRTATAIDHMFPKAVIDNKVEIGIIKADISDHFTLILNIKNDVSQEDKIEETNFTRVIMDITIEPFKQNPRNVDWNDLKLRANVSYGHFLRKCISLYDKFFIKVVVKPKRKNDFNPWLAKGTKSLQEKTKASWKAVENPTETQLPKL